MKMDIGKLGLLEGMLRTVREKATFFGPEVVYQIDNAQVRHSTAKVPDKDLGITSGMPLLTVDIFVPQDWTSRRIIWGVEFVFHSDIGRLLVVEVNRDSKDNWTPGSSYSRWAARQLTREA